MGREENRMKLKTHSHMLKCRQLHKSDKQMYPLNPQLMKL